MILEAFCDFPLNKIIVNVDVKYLQQHFKAIGEPFVDKVHSMFTAPYYYECNVIGIDKATVLKHIVHLYESQADEILASSDTHYDTTMLAYAGIGIVIGNAV